MGRSVFYSEEHNKIVESGIDAIERVFLGENLPEKESLLLCLDKYLDPWFGYKLAYEQEIIRLLEKVVVLENPLYIKQDALDLICAYAHPPFPLLEENLAHIDPILLPEVRYAISMR